MTGLGERFRRAVLRPRPPGPRGIALVRAANDLRRNGLATLERMAREYGDVVYLNMAGRHMFLISHPDLVEQVLIRNYTNYIKTTGDAQTRHFFGNAMQLNNGDYARAMRRIIAPVFNPEALARAYGETIVRETQAAMDRWQPGPRPGLTQELTDLVLDVAAQIFYGTEPGEDTRRMGRLWLAATVPAGSSVLPAWVPKSRKARYIEAVAALDAEVLGRIRERRRDPSSGGFDFLTVLARLEGKDGPALTERQVRDELVAYTLAGYSATTAINQVLRLVAEHRTADRALADELASVVGGRAPGIQDLPKLTYLDKVVKEALRLCSPAGVMFRRAVGPDVIGGWTIPAESRLFLSSWVVQRDPRFYDDPLAFKPERWTPEFERSLHTCAYFPFGRGPRSCIGGALGELIVQLVVATIAGRYRLEALRAIPAEESAWPRVLAGGGIRVDVHPRPVGAFA
jgi:cytochrome P450